ncbi:MAG TPA: GTP pyrophosphokinase [Ruminococcus sp.]|nr:GTP pyrophosphokinase [Ruminococcus sp.]
MNGIYGEYKPVLEKIKDDIQCRIEEYTQKEYETSGIKIYEHLIARVKSEESMSEKCRRKNLPETPESALKKMHDSIGLRIVCSFIEDIYTNIKYIKSFPNCKVISEKDYIKHAKPNGYRSYHMILEMQYPYTDINGNTPGNFYVEIQLRTIAMDSWAALEHKLKYKKNIANQELIIAELKRCADEMASCDISMQTIRDLITE